MHPPVVGHTSHALVPLAPTPGEISGIATIEARTGLQPGHMEAFDLLAVGERQTFPDGGRVEVVDFNGSINWRSGVFDSILRVLEVRLTAGAQVQGPVCWRVLEEGVEASPPATPIAYADRVVLPILLAAATLVLAFFHTGAAVICGMFALLIWWLVRSEDRDHMRLARIAQGGRMRILGPARKSWN